MIAWRMLLITYRLVGPYWFAPWRSPLLRWRMETYGLADAQGNMLSAQAITPTQFLAFCWTHRRALGAFLRWSATL